MAMEEAKSTMAMFTEASTASDDCINVLPEPLQADVVVAELNDKLSADAAEDKIKRVKYNTILKHNHARYNQHYNLRPPSKPKLLAKNMQQKLRTKKNNNTNAKNISFLMREMKIIKEKLDKEIREKRAINHRLEELEYIQSNISELLPRILNSSTADPHLETMIENSGNQRNFSFRSPHIITEEGNILHGFHDPDNSFEDSASIKSDDILNGKYDHLLLI